MKSSEKTNPIGCIVVAQILDGQTGLGRHLDSVVLREYAHRGLDERETIQTTDSLLKKMEHKHENMIENQGKCSVQVPEATLVGQSHHSLSLSIFFSYIHVVPLKMKQAF